MQLYTWQPSQFFYLNSRLINMAWFCTKKTHVPKVQEIQERSCYALVSPSKENLITSKARLSRGKILNFFYITVSPNKKIPNLQRNWTCYLIHSQIQDPQAYVSTSPTLRGALIVFHANTLLNCEFHRFIFKTNY